MTKLYELKRGSKFNIVNETVDTPPDAKDVSNEGVFTLRSIDGMYSYCLDPNGQVVHPAAWTEVTEVN